MPNAVLAIQCVKFVWILPLIAQRAKILFTIGIGNASPDARQEVTVVGNSAIPVTLIALFATVIQSIPVTAVSLPTS